MKIDHHENHEGSLLYANVSRRQFLKMSGAAIPALSFLAFNTVSYQGQTWRSTPFGVCYAVWAKVGADAVTGNLNTGWVSSTQPGVVGEATVYLPPGFSTVYFPVIKNTGTFSAGTQFNMRWVRQDNYFCDRGFMDMGHFGDSGVYNYNGYQQYTYSAMVYPVVCYASAGRSVTVRLSRNRSGVEAWLGRPIVLPRACSWFLAQ